MFGIKREAAPVAESAEAPTPPESQYVTRAECMEMIDAAVNAAIDAQAVINREIAGGSRDAFFSVGRLEGRLAREVSSEALSEAVARCLQRSVDAMSGKAFKEYGVERNVPRTFGPPR